MRRFAADLSDAGAGASTVHAALKIARLILGTALDAGAIKGNPAMGLRLPRVGRTEMLFLTAKQVEALAAAILPPYDTLIRFAAYTGLRAGEIGGLRAARLDLGQGVVELAEALADVNGTLTAKLEVLRRAGAESARTDPDFYTDSNRPARPR